MTRQKTLRICFRQAGKLLPLLSIGALALGSFNAMWYSAVAKAASDESVVSIVQDELAASEQAERLDDLENDVTYLLTEVSKLSQSRSGVTPAESHPADLEPKKSSGRVEKSETNTELAGSATQDNDRNQCAVPFANNYRKSIAFASFPRTTPSTSSAGALYKVDEHLPLLLSANMTRRHSTLSPIHMAEGLYNASAKGEAGAAAQTQILARKHRTQFIVSGEVKDMSLTYPDKANARGLYQRAVNGAANLFKSGATGNSESRIFGFQLQLRDGFTGQIVFDQYYETYGRWNSRDRTDTGFASPRFWQTDYGRNIQDLVARASDELAATINCNPYIARVDQQPGHRQVIIHSGASNGLRAGDTLALYQLVVQPVTGEYARYDTRLVNNNAQVYLTEVYPTHSVGNIDQNILLNGQYLAMAP